jgi:hypothetical protein
MSITAHRMTGGDTGIKERLQMLAPSLAGQSSSTAMGRTSP